MLLYIQKSAILTFLRLYFRYLHKALSKIGYKDDAIQELQEKSSKKNLKKFFVIFTTVACAQKLMDRHPRTFDGFRINIQEAVVPPFEIPVSSSNRARLRRALSQKEGRIAIRQNCRQTGCVDN